MLQSESILSVDNLSLSFGGIKALDHISFNVTKNSITAIIGPNGAGKTTVFNCITGFYKATSGQIYFRPSHEESYYLEKEMNGWLKSSHNIARLGISRTFQNIRLFSEMTTLENLLVAQHNHLNKNILSGIFNLKSYRDSERNALIKAKRWLEETRLIDFANRPAGELPYGHQRKLEIARAMCTNAKLICLDEPAAGLNHKETQDLSQLICLLRTDYNVTVLVIEHDMNLIMNVSDHIIVLDHGEVISTGTPLEIKNDKKVLAAYLGEEI